MKLNDATVQLIGMMGAVAMVIWLGGGKWAVVESKLNALAEIKTVTKETADRVGKVETRQELADQRMKAIEDMAQNTQANVRLLLRQNRETAKAGLPHLGPFGSR